MLFSSVTFVYIFLPITMVLVYLARSEYQNTLLLFFSLIFYFCGEPIYILLMLLSIIVNFFIGIGINKPTIGKKWYLVLAIIFNCGLLFTFKYLYPLTKEVTELIGNSSVLLKEIVLPIGISFYTFQILSYIIDLYRGEIAVQTNIIDFALYV